MLPEELREIEEEIRGHARNYGLDFFNVIFEILDFSQMNEVAAYDGFPTRYPHWKFGMEYERLQKSYAYGLHKIYEMVVNTNPCYAYLLACNNIVDQKTVIAHVFGHSDFFKNNRWFAHTDRKMLDEMANHATRIRNYIEKYGFETVENFLDICLSIDNLIDHLSPFIKRKVEKLERDLDEDEEEEEPRVTKLEPKERKMYMDPFLNPPEAIELERKKVEEKKQEKRKFPQEPEKDVLLFLIEHAPLEKWQRDILSIIREESYYFAPQAQTKIMNEGWACATGDSLLTTEKGMLRFHNIVEAAEKIQVDSGSGASVHSIIDFHKETQVPTIRITTRRGLTIEGALRHQVRLANKSWAYLSDIKIGDRVAIARGSNVWPKEKIRMDKVISARYAMRVPEFLDDDLAYMLGIFIGNGRQTRSGIALTHLNKVDADDMGSQVEFMFGIPATVHCSPSEGSGRWRVDVHSAEMKHFLTSQGIDLSAPASDRTVPPAILRSPRTIVSAFLRGYFDANGYTGKEGIILSSSSRDLVRTVQLLLLNYGILSTQYLQDNGNLRLEITGKSVVRFLNEIGFSRTDKRESLEAYIAGHRWFKRESDADTVVSIEHGCADVFDITVETSHAYVANGFINHNSYWHSKIMTEKVGRDSEIIDYADHHSGTLGTRPGRINPYKIGLELFRDIEDRWNKGKFGEDYEECDDIVEKRNWDKKLGQGTEKIFEVRKLYNDIGFIDTFLTEDFCEEQKLFTYRYNYDTEMYEIADRDFEKVKKQLLFSLTNFGQPFIYVQDGNYQNRGELYLLHKHEGIDLKLDYARDTLKNIQQIWQRPVHLETMIDETPVVMTYDGKEHFERGLDKAKMIESELSLLGKHLRHKI